MTHSDPNQFPDTARDIDPLELLEWYSIAGVDHAVAEAPINWLEHGPTGPGQSYDWPQFDDEQTDVQTSVELAPTQTGGRRAASASVIGSPHDQPQLERRMLGSADQTSRSSPSAPSRPRPQTPLAASGAETEARRIASQVTSLADLEAALNAFDGCSLKATATNLCLFRGATTARTMIIGEAPGREEDLEGRPFVGRAGQLLDKMLAAIGLTEADVHITNVVYWRPPGNRTPTPQEALACRPFLERQIALVSPDIIVAVGGSAAKEVLGVTDGIMRLRGSWKTMVVDGRTIPVIATLHPAYLLRTPAAKQMAWIDLLKIKIKLRGQ